ncbi:hypothetical protein [Neotabrizicola sp. VNH66]|uniref:hypothetical protein n=1 Tax=Neotabrizicola sp. VNH66 TaxID=3400918 RepID=UPI003BFD7BF4
MLEELAQSFNMADLVVSIAEGLAGNFVSAGLIAPIIALFVVKWRRARWRKFRGYLASLVEKNHIDLCADLEKTQRYMQKLSRFDPQEVAEIDDVEFRQHRDLLADSLRRMEEIGSNFHFAMEPHMLEAWADYHAEAWQLLREPNDLMWRNAEGVVAGVKRGYDGFVQNPSMFEDVFSGPMLRAAEKISKIDTKRLSDRKDAFVSVLN